MARGFVVLGAVLGLLGVALGAFGAHALSARLAANGRADTFNTAVQYHQIHALALLAVGVVYALFPAARPLALWAGWALLAGVLVFSGSLYVLAIGNVRVMGALAPVGGVLMLAGWGLLVAAAWRGVGNLSP